MRDHTETATGGQTMKVKTHLKAGVSKPGGAVDDTV
jgi:hypothetical protein